jgi:signal transduction histidine kinase
MKILFADRNLPGFAGALCSAALLLCFAFPATAQAGRHGEGTTITASMPASWPPHYLTLPDGKPTGFAVEILDAVAEQAGYKISYRVTETMREAYDLAATGEVDLMPNVGAVPSRMDTFAFTDPVETFVVSIFVRADSRDITSAADLAGRRVAVIKRNMGLKLMSKRDDVESVVFDDVRSALFDLVAGRVDAMVYPAPVLHDLAQQVGIDHRIKTVGEPLLEVKRAVAVHPSRTEIHRRLSAAVSEFVGTPEYQEIYLRWFGRPPEYWTVARVLTLTGGAMVLVVLGFSLWHYRTVINLNRTLEDRVEQRTRALRDAEAELRRKERLAALGELTGTVAHELRNPLGAIVTSFTIIKSKLRGTKDGLSRSFERAERNIDRCTGIIDDLLEYAQIRTAKRESTDFDGLIRDILDEYGLPAGISLDMDLGLGDRTVAVDPDQIRRIIVNFLDNSCQSIAARTDGDAADGLIRVCTQLSGEGVELSVSDNGTGIPPDILDRIFEPLFSTKSFGIGLGLPNAQNIVAGHGGRLVVANEPGGGASVSVWLPEREESQTEAA